MRQFLANYVREARGKKRGSTSFRSSFSGRRQTRENLPASYNSLKIASNNFRIYTVGTSTVGLDLGPSTVAIVPREGQASLAVFCEPLDDAAKPIRRLQRKMDRQRRAANPDNYDEKGRIKRGVPLHWKTSTSYQKTRARKATKERKVAAHRKNLHGKLAHEIVALGNRIHLEKISYKAWQKTFGKSIGKRAPGLFVEHLRRTVVVS
jgi:hypothetical protein